jgi:hypothetical protein
MASISPLLAKVYAELVGGVVGVLLVYCGGNVTNKLVTKTPSIPLKE